MSHLKNLSLFAICLFVFNSCAHKTSLPRKSEVIQQIHKANTFWQTNYSPKVNAFWDNAAYHTGNMAAYRLLKDSAYLKYSIDWANHNEWKGARSVNSVDWKYKPYGEGQNFVLFGDWQICFQTYIDLYNIDPDEKKIARAKEVMSYQINTPEKDYWWWVDGLYMVMPVMTQMYNLTGDTKFLDKLYSYWEFTNSIMYDKEEGVYFRDAKYIYPKHKTPNGKKDFWARGNGWAFAAFAKILQDLPKTDPHRETYIAYYQRMAEKLAECQLPEGYWSRSLLDTDYAAGYETSGTAFFTYGYLWGMNNGYLSKTKYLPVVDKAWKYLSTIALQENGKVGYVQPIGENAGQHKVNAETTANFGVGAFLLAATEMAKFVK
ncbi:glycoside hydrolase family 88 protein [Paludibacter sp.]